MSKDSFEPDIEVEDEEMYGGSGQQGGFSIKQIALGQFKKCADELSKPNNIESWMNSVKALYAILKPEIEDYREIKTAIEDIDEEVKKIENKYKNIFESLRTAEGDQNDIMNNLIIQEQCQMKEEEGYYWGVWLQLSKLLKKLNYFDEEWATNKIE